MTLTDRYVQATARDLPAARRAEIGRELRASIADEVDERIAGGEPVDQAEYAVLDRLGDPIRLAASYTDRPLALIGPAAYPAWRRLLVLLWTIVVPVIGVVVGVEAVLDDQSAVGVLGTVLGTAITVAVHLAVWVTVIFAVLERRGAFDTEARAGFDGDSWTPEQLPTISDDPQIGWGETIIAVLWSAALIVLLVSQRWFDVDGSRLPILDPDLWSSWIPVLLVALAAGATLSIVMAIHRCVTRTRAWVNLAVATAFSAPVIWLAAQDRLLNPAFVARFEWLSDNVDAINTAIIVTAGLSWALDVTLTFNQAWRPHGEQVCHGGPGRVPNLRRTVANGSDSPARRRSRTCC